MEFIKIALCDKSLQVSGINDQQSALPPLAWKGFLLNHFERTEGEALELSGRSKSSLGELLSDLHPRLSFIKLAMLYHALSNQPALNEDLDWTQIFTTYGYRFSHQFEKTLLLVKNLPASFSDWAHEKKLAANDFAVLRSLADFDLVRNGLNQIAQLQPSKATGIQLLELYCDLRLMGFEDSDCLKQSNHGDKWLKHMRCLRYPLSQARAESSESTLKSLRWPRGIQPMWSRRGDQSGLELRLFARSREELGRQLDELESLNSKMKGEQSPWEK